MKFSSLEIKRNYYAKQGEFEYTGTLFMTGEFGSVNVNLSEQTIKAVLAATSVDASALLRGAALQATAELTDLAEVSSDAPHLPAEVSSDGTLIDAARCAIESLGL